MKVLDRFLNRYKDKVENIQLELNCKGYDSFGLNKDFLAKMISLAEPFYKHYFRVQTFGLENIPKDGRILLISNHSGQIPVDGAMIGLALFLELNTPRFVRSMVERWVPELPFISTIFNKAGQILGTRENAKQLLENDNALLVFPEGVKGINKPFMDRYKLAEFGTGFLRLALQTNTPIVPIAVIGAEEQIPVIANFKNLGEKLGLPALPIPVFPGILPSKYRIYFGKPFYFEENENTTNEDILSYVNQVKDTIQEMINNGLNERKHIFW
jgi:1-acyl-sn-glycerol-3-phosphate acyltransferase